MISLLFRTLKSYVSNPFKKEAGPRVFRARLIGLIRRIKEVAPNAKVVIPSFPTQMFHKHSPLNIFPLNFFLDTVIGFWDSQKKMVADALPSEIMYFEIDPAEIFDWHEFEDGKDRHGSTLIAADGVHPNAKCYRLWANSLGTRIATSIDKTASKRNRHQFT
jgi:lysophospholipase L1-like esterase